MLFQLKVLSLAGLFIVTSVSCATAVRRPDPETVKQIGKALVEVAKDGDGTVAWEAEAEVKTLYGSGTYREKLTVGLGQLENPDPPE